jgi:anti-anti-sigma regulatory factor
MAKKPAPFLLPEAVTAWQVADLHPQLLEAVDKNRPVDASAVTRVDALGCQLLASCQLTARAKGRQGVLHHLSAPLLAAVDELGLSGLFGKEDV